MLSDIVAASERNVFVTIKNGKLKGIILQSYSGREFHAFKAIPYGKSTAGDRRFQPPVGVEPWDEVLDATQAGPECPQMYNKAVIGTENCLVINVYIPQLIGRRRQPKLPILAYIHGGGFESGSGSSRVRGPEKFMDYDVILVTFNYRLGLFGYFCTGDGLSPGNYGMLDQVMALRWIQDNIASFGGNPNQVTIFGESAGGTSVVYHLLSPLSEGLFKSAIVQSGSPFNPWSFQKNPLKWPTKAAAQLKCDTNDSKSIYDCFKAASVDDLVIANAVLHRVPVFPMYAAPCVEGPGGYGFLNEDPLVLMKEGRIPNKVPLFAGFTSGEGYVYFILLKFQSKGMKFLESEFDDFFSLIYDVDPELTSLISAVENQYFANSTTPSAIERQTINLISDALYRPRVTKVLNLFADANVPTFAYKYVHKQEHSYAEIYGGVAGKYVSHADETLLQFPNGFPKLNENDKKMSIILNSLWADIASGRRPKVSSEFGTFFWKRYHSKKPRYLRLDLKPKIKRKALSNVVDFWFETVPHLSHVIAQ